MQKQEIAVAARAVARKVTDMGFTRNGKKMGPAMAREVVAAIHGVRNSHVLASHVPQDPPALLQDDPEEAGNDYTLLPDQKSVWISVDGVSVHVCRRDNGVEVYAYPKGSEMSHPMAHLYAVQPGDMVMFLVACLHDGETADDILIFEALADDEEHAEEQARDAYPNRDRFLVAADLESLVTRVYEDKGPSMAIRFAEIHRLPVSHCHACETETPYAVTGECLLCGQISDPRVDVLLPDGTSSIWEISQNLTDRWGELNTSSLGKSPSALSLLENDEELLQRLSAAMVEESSFVVRKDGRFGVLIELEFASAESECDDSEEWSWETTEEARKDLALRIFSSSIQEDFPKVEFCIPSEDHIINDRPAVWAFIPEPVKHKRNKELLNRLMEITGF